ncbi:hypothetical protein GOP47_0019378 [Adiantum capillus-veneris]|uniref:Uncharacterized protein n=1 Tax=Adiantum capillus-veneris TaxID=13818 RepID=A0A9D4UBX6_ADICA|nr:hypothetical protein GOP47_0019378 [Adiantum capillus-veneris]
MRIRVLHLKGLQRPGRVLVSRVICVPVLSKIGNAAEVVSRSHGIPVVDIVRRITKKAAAKFLNVWLFCESCVSAQLNGHVHALCSSGKKACLEVFRRTGCKKCLQGVGQGSLCIRAAVCAV